MTAKREASEVVAGATHADTLKIAAFGKYGSRKTLAIGQLIDLVGAENVLIVSAERGLNTIKSKLTVPENVVVVESIDGLRSAWKRASEFASPSHWVCVDGASEVMSWIANEQISGADKYYDLKCRNLTIPEALAPYGRFITDKGGVDNIRIYGRIGRESENFLASWIRLNANLYFSYLEDMTGSSGYEKTIPWGPDVPGRVGLKAVMSSFDYVIRLFADNDGNITAGMDATSRLYLARTREDRTLVKLPKELPNFDMGSFVKLLLGEGAGTAPGM